MTHFQPLRVVIADDEALVCRLIQAELEKLGHLVIGRAADGVQAVRLVAETRPDVAILDLTMPELDGIEATKLIQAERPTPIVILTAHEDPVLVNAAARAGSGAYLVKPPAARELERAMVIAIARHDAQMKLSEANQDLQRALAEVKTLHGLLPICSRCKKIRDERGYWNEVEKYLAERTHAQFTHGMCAECAKFLFPGIDVTLLEEPNRPPAVDCSTHLSLTQPRVASRSALVLDKMSMMKRANNDEQLAATAVFSTLADFPERISALRDYLDAGNLAGARLVAESIRLSALVIGADAMRDAGSNVAQAASRQEVDRAKLGIAQLEHEFLELPRVARREFPREKW